MDEQNKATEMNDGIEFDRLVHVISWKETEAQLCARSGLHFDFEIVKKSIN